MADGNEDLARELTYLRGYLHSILPLLKAARVTNIIIAVLLAIIAVEILIRR